MTLRRGSAMALLAGAALLALFIAIAAISPRLDRFLPLTSQPRGWFVGLLIAAGAVWFAWAMTLVRRGGRLPQGGMLWIVLVGIAMRAAMFAAPPILEDDYHRYLWDGAVAAHGLNPYATAPADALAASSSADGEADGRLAALAEEGEATLQRVNHPTFRTVYPPTTQAAFAVAHWLGPWQVWSMRAVLLAFDAATALLLVALLGRLALPRSWVMLYWCNPLLVMQTIGAVHMDAIAMAFVVLALLLGLRRWAVGSAIALALAAGAKVWPVMLLPLVLRYAGRPAASPAEAEAEGGEACRMSGAANAPRMGHCQSFLAAAHSALALLVFAGLAVLLAWPILAAGLGPDSGFTAYTGRWDNNAGLFTLQREMWRALLPRFDVHPGHGDNLTRYVTAGLMALLILALSLRRLPSGRALVDRCLIAVAAMFLLSPTQFPWYFAWLLPLLALRPVPALMLYTALLPLYYLQHLGPAVLWLQHAPVLALLLFGAVRRLIRPNESSPIPGAIHA